VHRYSAAAQARLEQRETIVETTIEYDSLSNRTREWNTLTGESFAVSHEWDNLGLPKRSRYADKTVTRGHDALGRLKDVWLDGAKAVDYQYAPLGPPRSRTYGSGVVTTYSYDLLGRLTELSDDRPSGATTLSRWRWRMPVDGVPRVATQTLGALPPRTYLYEVDRMGRLLAEARETRTMDNLVIGETSLREVANRVVTPALEQSASRRRYTLDARHNWVERNAAEAPLNVRPGLNALDQYTTFREGDVTYERNGAVSRIGAVERYAYDLFGLPQRIDRFGRVRLLKHDAFGRLVEIREESGGDTAQFAWDGPRRAIVKHPDGRREIVVDGDGLDEHLLLLTKRPAFVPEAPSPRPPTGDNSGGVGPGGGPLVDAVYYYHQDRAGSVYMLTTSAGRLAEAYEYSAYGERAVRGGDGRQIDGSAIGNPFAYQGQAIDEATGLVYMRNRWYRPEWGRFLSADPLGLAGGGNLYAFVMSAPLKYTDPWGLLPDPVGQADQIRDRHMPDPLLGLLRMNERAGRTFAQHGSFSRFTAAAAVAFGPPAGAGVVAGAVAVSPVGAGAAVVRAAATRAYVYMNAGNPGFIEGLGAVGTAVGFGAQGWYGATGEALVAGVAQQGAVVATDARGARPTIRTSGGPAISLGAAGADDVLAQAIPAGFQSEAAYREFAARLTQGLQRAGYEGVDVLFQGSAVTGRSFRTGAPFDVGRLSDFDIALAGENLLNAAASSGVGLRSGGSRTGPLGDAALGKLGLYELRSFLTGLAGREVNFMIYRSTSQAVERAPSVLVLP
jgi:RHS repeat-associated protein